MKVTKQNTEPKFQPVTISITLESEEEVDILRQMFGYENSIPNMLRDECGMSTVDRNLLSQLMVQIYRGF